MRAIRGQEISMIFQEPMTSLHSVFIVGEQFMEAIVLHQRVSRGEARARLDAPYRLLPTVDDFMDARVVNGRLQVTEKPLSAARLNELKTHGRGRMLHPKSELAAMGHPWELCGSAADARAVDEGAQPLLEVKHLEVHFPVRHGLIARVRDQVRAVDGVSFRVYRGQTLGLVGESGCGKTTAGRAILRLIEPTAGRVLVDGVDLGRLSGRELRNMRRRMQIVFQDPYGSVNPRMTIEATITEPMSIQGLGGHAREPTRV